MTRATSRAAFAELDLPDAQAKALLALRLHGPATAMEIEQASGLRHLNKRTSELVRQGLAHESGRRTCKVSGRTAIVWSVGKATAAPRPLVQQANDRGTRGRAQHSTVLRYCVDHTGDLSARLHDVGEVCAQPGCSRYVANVSETDLRGTGVLSRIVTTYPGD